MKKTIDRYSDYVLYLLIAAFCGAALLFSTATRDLGLLKKTAFQLLVNIAATVFTYGLIKRKMLQIKWTVELKIFFALLLYFLFNLCLQFLPSDFVILYSGIEGFFRFCVYFAFVFCLYNTIYNQGQLRLIFITVTVLSIISVVYGYFQMAGIDVKLVGQYAWGDLKASFGNPQFYGAFILTAVFINAAGIAVIKNKNYRFFSAFAIVNLLIQLPSTEARSSFLGLAAAVLTALILIIVRFKNIRKYAISVSLAVFLIFAVFVFIEDSPANKIYEGVKQRFSVVEYGTGRMRISSYMSAMRCIYDNYFLGAGIGSYQIIDPFYRSPLYKYEGITNNQLNTHSEELQIWQETGIIGLTIYYLLIAVLYLRAGHFIFRIKSGRGALAMIFLTAGFTAVWIQNFFDVALRFTSGAVFFWLNFTLMICMIERKFISNGLIKSKEPPVKYSKILAAKAVMFFLIALFAALARYHYNNYITNSMLQLATSYERPDSRFYDEKNQEAPHLRYKYLIEFYTEGNKRNKYDYETYYKLAHCYYSINDFDRALEIYYQLQKYAPFYANLNYNISLCYFNRKDYNNAVYYLNREISSNYTVENSKKLYYYLNEKYKGGDNTSILKNSIWLEKDNPEYRSFLALEYFMRNRFFEAIEQYELTARLFTNYGLYTSGLTDAAKTNKIAEFNTLKIEAFKNIGVIYHTKLNNNKLAVEYFNHYTRLTDNVEEKNKVLSLIDYLKNIGL